MQAKERLLKLVRRIVEERKAAMDRGDHETLKGPPNDAVDVLLRDTGDSSETSRLSLDFISSNMIEMMIPGEETLPTAGDPSRQISKWLPRLSEPANGTYNPKLSPF